MAHPRRGWSLLCAILAVLLAACGSGARGLPSAPGEYPLQGRSVAFDGHNYSFSWVAPDGAIHQAKTSDVKLVQDERSFLSVGQGPPVLHLAQDEPVAVQGRDNSGSFSSWWFPFFLGHMLGSGPSISTGPPANQPSYRYPPTDKFGRGDTLQGSEATSRPSPPDYSKVKPAPNAVSGQNSGTGAGTAASNRDAGAAVSGQSGGAGSGTAASDRNVPAVSGQSGGTGSGSAATDRGRGTSAGDQSAAGSHSGAGSGSSVGAPQAAPAPNAGSSSRPPASSGGSRSGGGVRSGGRR